LEVAFEMYTLLSFTPTTAITNNNRVMILQDNKIVVSEAQWIESLKKGDEKAFRKIYDQYHRRLYYFSLRFTATDEAAREIVQEVFMKLWTNREAINPDLSLQGYLYTIARHLNFKSLQHAARDLILREEMIYRCAGRYHDSEDEVIYAEYLKIAEDAVEQLPPHRKLVYRMSWQDGLSPQEISRNLNISVSTVKNHLVEARKDIKEHLLLYADIPVGMVLFISACFV
jgi:RNA polymerase sigma-70 factor (family 1)